MKIAIIGKWRVLSISQETPGPIAGAVGNADMNIIRFFGQEKE
jgi:hypothetical protein